MGQAPSLHADGQGSGRKSFRHTWRSPFPRRSQTHQGSLSAAFNYNDICLKVEQLNINTASEEELMTLPGVTRAVAHSIVTHRQAIGGFKKVEDLALVTGVGAERLDLVRPEICIGHRRNASCASSRTQSEDSLHSAGAESTGQGVPRGCHVVNVNTASVFELMTVRGLNQELAANIVDHRDRRGPFCAVEDLLKVRGVNQWRLAAVRSQLVVDTDQPPPPSPAQLPNGDLSGTKSAATRARPGGVSNGFLPGKDVFDVLSLHSPRPPVTDSFRYSRNGKSALRVATWNLGHLTLAKVGNPGVRETICRTVLENRLSLVAVQEVVDESSLEKICDELNNPSLLKVAEWPDNEKKWKFATTKPLNDSGQALGFLYDAGRGAELCTVRELNVAMAGCSSGLPVQAALATFKLASLRVCLLNVFLRSSDLKCISSIEQVIQRHVKQTDMFVILGDFSGLGRNKGADEIQRLRYKCVAPMSTDTSSGCASRPLADNIFLNPEMQLQFTGEWQVVRHGLRHLAIPAGWTWGGAASDHCPVWCEVYTQPVLAEVPGCQQTA
ncbi:endonuclease/exonuclease/phosphatase family domain-containing protein 1-like isoform X2 [Bacillus rossius redtenbacheri]|uniref:endonuclease/exonuclease/phosphatase family domain-containing protein 1-like isoform X2 n=1 Tax=Bacillus rossius redtenbacheri TaxID=93214 RepID=UPI002FDDCCD8